MRGSGTAPECVLKPGGWKLWALFLGLATLTQIAFKWGALLRSPAVGLAVLGYIVMFVVWMHILQRTSLARAFTMTGLV